MRGEEAKQAEQEVEHLAADMKKEIPQPGKTETAQNPQRIVGKRPANRIDNTPTKIKGWNKSF